MKTAARLAFAIVSVLVVAAAYWILGSFLWVFVDSLMRATVVNIMSLF